MRIPQDCSLVTPKPCCLVHYATCWAGCGDPSKVLRRFGMLVGVFCVDCFRELAHGEIPAAGLRRPRRMGSRARMRHAQNQAD